MENGNRQLKTLVVENGGDKSREGWLPRLRECALTLNVRGTTGVPPLERRLCFSGGSGGRESREGRWDSFCPHITSTFFFFLPDVVVTGPGLQLQGVQTGMVPKRETLTVFHLHVTSPKGLTGQDVP